MISAEDILKSKEFNDSFQSIVNEQVIAVTTVDLELPDAKDKLFAIASKMWAVQEVRSELEARLTNDARA